MDSKQIEIDGMKELLKENELEIGRLRKENKNLREQLIQRNIQNDNLGIKNKKLIEENKNLKVIIKNNDLEQKADWKHIEELEQENNNLKNELMEDMKTETKLNEEIKTLKSELSKFSDSFKRYRDYEKEELAESCYDLARENEKLKEEIGKLVMKS